MPRNDGSEQAELNELNVLRIRKGTLEVRKLRAELNIAKGGATDAYNQTRESFVLLGECRDLLEITALESPLRKDILDLICKIDSFKGDRR